MGPGVGVAGAMTVAIPAAAAETPVGAPGTKMDTKSYRAMWHGSMLVLYTIEPVWKVGEHRLDFVLQLSAGLPGQVFIPVKTILQLTSATETHL